MDDALNAQIQNQGWELTKVKFDKGSDRFVAEAQSPHGEKLDAWGPTDDLALQNLLYNIVHRNQTRMASAKLARWKTMFTSELQAIAQAYSKAPVYQSKASIAFMELGKDCMHRAMALAEHLQVEIVNEPEPYPDAKAMSEDVRKRRRLKVSKAGLDHPVWSDDEALAYRTCMDVFGYAAANADWGWEGTNLAFSYFAPLLSVEAQKALFTEAIAHSAYSTYYRSYGPMKVALFPQFLDRVQEQENPHGGYSGIHPDSIIPPTEKPAIKPLAHLTPDARYSSALIKRFSQGVLEDPNANWSSPVSQPLPINARADYGDPLQAKEARDTASLIDTGWAKLNQEDPTELNRMREAIENAFRVVLLSPLKDLRFNAVHYQDLMGARSSNPTDLWNHLEQKRQDWNVARFGEDARYEHKPYIKEQRQLERLFYEQNPEAGWQAAKQEAADHIFHMHARFQNRLLAEHKDKGKNEEQIAKTAYKDDLKAAKMTHDYLKGYLSPHAEWDEYEGLTRHPGQTTLAAMQEKLLDVPQDQVKYAGFIGNHLVAISQIREHIDDILKAALKDVEQGGRGNLFRSTVLQLGISGVGPKVASFAWLLLQPLTSELATIDTHIAKFLGVNYDKEMNTRDYFKYERQLRGGLDAAGYQDLPLGVGQWTAWDHARSGPGTHQDHSAMKVLDPTPHEQIPWAAHASSPTGDTYNPEWWRLTQGVRDQVGDDWDKNVASNVPQNQVPWNLTSPANNVMAKTASVLESPWFIHPETHEKVIGKPGETIASHLGRSGFKLPDIWAFSEDAVGKELPQPQLPESPQIPESIYRIPQ